MEEKIKLIRERLDNVLSNFLKENNDPVFDRIIIRGDISFHFEEDNNLVSCPRTFENEIQNG